MIQKSIPNQPKQSSFTPSYSSIVNRITVARPRRMIAAIDPRPRRRTLAPRHRTIISGAAPAVVVITAGARAPTAHAMIPPAAAGISGTDRWVLRSG